MAALQPGMALQGGNFVILAKLGEGGFGAVYRARQLRLDREVAIKVLHPEHARREDIVARFRREALAAASLAHPNVLPVFDFDYDQEADLWFLAMQYVRGARSLNQVDAPLDPGETARIIAGVASALDAAHARGIVHRDLKPANVLMDGAHPLLTDFGIAYLGTMTSITGVGLAIGTPVYMSPEQAMGRDVSPRSDQYSLAVMTYQLLVGYPPFRGDAPALLYQHVHEPAPPPDSLNQSLPAPVAGPVLRAMSKQPDDRFASCTEFALALAAATGALPAGAPSAAPAAAGTMTVESPVPAAQPAPTEASPLAIAAVGKADAVASGVAPAAAPAAPEPASAVGRLLLSRAARLAGGGVAILVLVAIALVAVRESPGTTTETPPTVPRVGAVLLADDFNDPAAGYLPAASPDSPFRIGYVDGEYEIAGTRGGFVALPGVFRDSSLSVDVRLVGDATRRAIGVACRASEEGWYQVTVIPDTRSFSLAKFSLTGSATTLIADQVSAAILRGNPVNRLELTCSGTTIAPSANGTPLGSVQDETYREGWYQVSVLATVPDLAPGEEVALRLDNLSVTQR